MRQARERSADDTITSTIETDPAVVALQAQLDAVDQEANVLNSQESRLQRDMTEYRRRIAVQPEVQQQLDTLNERRKSLRDRYQRLQAQADEAKGSAVLEGERMLGRQMEVLEYASVPSSPYAPEPMKFYAVGMALGCLIFVGPLLARTLLSPVILSEEGFRALSDFPVLVSIPNLQGGRSIAVRRIFKNLGFAVLSGVVLVATKLFFIFNV